MRDLPIWTKLGLIMIVPTLATIIVGTAGLLDHVQAANDADRARTLAVLAGDAGNLVHDIQDERSKAVQLLNTPSASKDDVGKLTTELTKLESKTDLANAQYHRTRSTVADIPDNLRALLDRIETQLGELTAMRGQIAQRTAIPRSIAEQRYNLLISDLLQIRDLAAQLTGDPTLSARLRAAGAIATAKEFLSQERVVVLQALADKEMTEAIRRQFVNTRNGQDLALVAFTNTATPSQVQLYNRTLTGPEVRTTLQDEGRLEALTVGNDPSKFIRDSDWDSAMSGRADLMNQVESELNSQAQNAAIDLGARVQRQVLLETGLLLLTLLLGVLFAWLVARSMARSLRDLRQGALAVAQYGLPQAVARLRDPALSAHLSPAGVALQIAEPLPVRSMDEFGQVTEAFNAVHLEAVKTAAEQAALRASVATMFVNLARRSQILVDRLIGHLDRLERGEQDPDRLAELFQLDHLATRMRRNDENLLVLAGADSTRIQREPAALMDVLRAAQSEVEHYTRIEFGVIDQDIEIAAHAVNDLVHLVAELFDNATAFSPPDTAVTVEARRLGDRAVLQVEDRGIGMSPDQYAELNDKLATPPMVDVAVSRMMGLVVVARLAARHGVKTELRPATGRGTVADVLMPSGVLVPRALAGRGQMPTGFPAAQRPGVPAGPPAPTRPSPFGPPLALESGPTAAPAWGANGSGNGYNGANGNGGGYHAAPAWPGGANPPSPSWGAPAPAPTWGGGEPPAPAASPTWSAPPAAPWSSEPAAWSGEPAAPVPVVPPWGTSEPAPPPSTPSLWGEEPRTPYVPPPPVAPPAGPGGAVPAGLGAALAGERGYQPPRPGSGGNGRRAAMPAWADLAGAGPAEAAPAETDPLPQRRPQWGTDEEVPHARPAAGPGGFGAPPAGAWPPAWPPGAEEGVPPVPGSLAASLDMTGELPRMRPGQPDYASDPSYGNDMTMELPIFSELESAWFRPPDAPAASPPGWPSEPGESARIPTGDSWSDDPAMASAGARRSSWAGGSEGAGGHASEVSWRTAADEGWQAAQAATELQDGGNTDMGLPRRVPMAQLVPGGVDTASGGSDRRTPDAVRGLLSAYTRGVQRGRSAHGGTTDTDALSSGKEQEA